MQLGYFLQKSGKYLKYQQEWDIFLGWNDFVLLTALFSRTKFKLKANKGNAGGCAPPDLRQGLRPWTHSSRKHLLGSAKSLRVLRWRRNIASFQPPCPKATVVYVRLVPHFCKHQREQRLFDKSSNFRYCGSRVVTHPGRGLG